MTNNPRRLGRNHHVLVADDNEINQLVFRVALEEAGYTVKIVNNGRKAADTATLEKPPIILMDINMPVLDGYDAMMEIRKFGHVAGYRPYIVAVTAQAMRADRQKCLNAGADAYMAKPISPEELVALLDDVILPGS